MNKISDSQLSSLSEQLPTLMSQIAAAYENLPADAQKKLRSGLRSMATHLRHDNFTDSRAHILEMLPQCIAEWSQYNLNITTRLAQLQDELEGMEPDWDNRSTHVIMLRVSAETQITRVLNNAIANEGIKNVEQRRDAQRVEEDALLAESQQCLDSGIECLLARLRSLVPTLTPDNRATVVGALDFAHRQQGGVSFYKALAVSVRGICAEVGSLTQDLPYDEITRAAQSLIKLPVQENFAGEQLQKIGRTITALSSL